MKLLNDFFLKKAVMYLLVILIPLGWLYVVYQDFTPERQKVKITQKSLKVGDKVDSLHGVYVYHNGKNYTKGYGYNWSKDKYLLGQKWQCVEFVKRYYYEVFDHKMPNVYGNATNFFYPQIPHGNLNADRNLIQYKNGKSEKPKVHDLLVFQNSKYGHVAIVSKVGEDYVEIIQQNILYTPRERLPMYARNGTYRIGKKYKPVGWLRKE